MQGHDTAARACLGQNSDPPRAELWHGSAANTLARLLRTPLGCRGNRNRIGSYGSHARRKPADNAGSPPQSHPSAHTAAACSMSPVEARQHPSC